jgi:hypothetical protein
MIVMPEQFLLFGNMESKSVETAAASPPLGRFSNFVVYVDESGDHGIQKVDPNYPIFVLAFCVFYKGHYCEKVVPALQKFKFNHFGHGHVVLHEHEIRKETGNFKFQSRHQKHVFLNQLTSIMEISNFILISCVIDKTRLCDKQELQSNPYHLALGFCLETLQ